MLQSSFYERNTLEVAPALLGKILVVDSPEGVVSGRIVETEAYRAGDPASHSSRGLTPRTKVMFGEPGVAYVYFIYGMYEMFNVVTEKKGHAGAVLIRAVEPLAGESLMQKRRQVRLRRDLTCGPGRLCAALGIQRRHNRQSLQGPELTLLEPEGLDRATLEKIHVSPRVGISSGQEKMWRFFLMGNPFVSRVKENSRSVPYQSPGRG